MNIKADLKPSRRYDKAANAISTLPPEVQEDVHEVILSGDYTHADVADWLTKHTRDNTGDIINGKQVADYARKLKRGAA